MIATIIDVEVKPSHTSNRNYLLFKLKDDYETICFSPLGLVGELPDRFLKRNGIYFDHEWSPKELIGMIVSVTQKWERYADKTFWKTELNLGYRYTTTGEIAYD